MKARRNRRFDPALNSGWVLQGQTGDAAMLMIVNLYAHWPAKRVRNCNIYEVLIVMA